MKISEAFPSKYLKAADLQGRSIVAVIAKVEMEDLGGEGKPADIKPVASFANRQKQLPLNKTNAMALVQLYGDDTADWIGKQVEVFPSQTQMQGRIVDCIRVKVPAVVEEELEDDIAF